jgi:hypothetical protein
VLYTCVLWKVLGKYIAALFPLFFKFLCEASRRCVVGRLDGDLVCPDNDSGYPEDIVDSSRRPGFCDLLRGTTSGCHFCSILMVNPVGLNRILPAPHVTFSSPFVTFCHLVHFPFNFYAYFLRAHVVFGFYLFPRYVFTLFY